MNMHRRRERPDVPVNQLENVVRRALERGRLPDLLFDEADGRGSLFMNRILRAITALPAVDRVLAADQVKSRFVRKIVSWGVDNRDNSYQGVYPCGWFLTRCWIPARGDSEESRAIALFPWVSSRGLQGSPRGRLRRDPRGDSSFGQT